MGIKGSNPFFCAYRVKKFRLFSILFQYSPDDKKEREEENIRIILEGEERNIRGLNLNLNSSNFISGYNSANARVSEPL